MQLKSPKDRLKELEATSKYVFHGSNTKLDELEPRQQTRFDPEKKISVPDGKPAVCTTPYAEIAIFRSIVSSHTAKEWGIPHYYSEFLIGDVEKPIFKATQNILDAAKKQNAVGYVHVFHKDDFHKHNNMEWRAQNRVKPVEIIEVSVSDLPENIQIVESPI